MPNTPTKGIRHRPFPKYRHKSKANRECHLNLQYYWQKVRDGSTKHIIKPWAYRIAKSSTFTTDMILRCAEMVRKGKVDSWHLIALYTTKLSALAVLFFSCLSIKIMYVAMIATGIPSALSASWRLAIAVIPDPRAWAWAAGGPT